MYSNTIIEITDDSKNIYEIYKSLLVLSENADIVKNLIGSVDEFIEHAKNLGKITEKDIAFEQAHIKSFYKTVFNEINAEENNQSKEITEEYTEESKNLFIIIYGYGLVGKITLKNLLENLKNNLFSNSYFKENYDTINFLIYDPDDKVLHKHLYNFKLPFRILSGIEINSAEEFIDTGLNIDVALFNDFDSLINILKNIKDDYKNYKKYNSIEENIETVFISCLPTNIIEDKLDYSPFIDLEKNLYKLKKNFDKNLLFINRSSTPPGFMKNILNKLDIKKYVHIPERINLLSSYEEFIDKNKTLKYEEYPLIIGIDNFDDKTLQELIFHFFPEYKMVAYTNETELAKIMENYYRRLNISFQNLLYEVSRQFACDYKIVKDLISTKNDFYNQAMTFNPGLIGGSCIGVDEKWLEEQSKNMNLSNLNYALDTIDFSVYNFIKNYIKALLDFSKIEHLIVFGTGYKDNIKDTKFSKTYELIKELKELYPQLIIIEGDKAFDNIETIKEFLNYNPYHFILLNENPINKEIRKLYKERILFDLSKEFGKVED